jgi:hypothetical protein
MHGPLNVKLSMELIMLQRVLQYSLIVYIYISDPYEILFQLHDTTAQQNLIFISGMIPTIELTVPRFVVCSSGQIARRNEASVVLQWCRVLD